MALQKFHQISDPNMEQEITLSENDDFRFYVSYIGIAFYPNNPTENIPVIVYSNDEIVWSFAIDHSHDITFFVPLLIDKEKRSRIWIGPGGTDIVTSLSIIGYTVK